MTVKPEKKSLEIIVPEGAHAERIDRFLANALPDYSRSFFADLIEHKHILLNGSSLDKSSYTIKPHDKIQINFPTPAILHAQSIIETAHGVELLFEHEHFLILYKPAGLNVHPPKINYDSPTLTDWLKLSFKEIESVGLVDRPGIVHRLDKDTSGLIIIARTNYAHKTFTALFQEHGVHKTYLALVHGHPRAEGTIDLPIGRDRYNRKKRAVSTGPDTIAGTARDALTHYKVISYFEDYALVEVKPVTGRTHQIRVHSAAIGHPLVGDMMYGTKKTDLIARHALHAHAISFIFDNQEYTFTRALPDDFTAAIAQCTLITPIKN